MFIKEQKFDQKLMETDNVGYQQTKDFVAEVESKFVESESSSDRGFRALSSCFGEEMAKVVSTRKN